MKLLRVVTIVGALLLLSSAAHADEFLYTYQSGDFDWTAELPIAPDFPAPTPGQGGSPILITSFLTFSINPTSFIAANGCNSITQAGLFIAFFPNTQNVIDTGFSGPMGATCSDLVSTFGAVVGTGTFTYLSGNPGVPEATLTVTDLTTPEPSSILLLGIGLFPAVGLAKRKFGLHRFAK